MIDRSVRDHKKSPEVILPAAEPAPHCLIIYWLITFIRRHLSCGITNLQDLPKFNRYQGESVCVILLIINLGCPSAAPSDLNSLKHWPVPHIPLCNIHAEQNRKTSKSRPPPHFAFDSVSSDLNIKGAPYSFRKIHLNPKRKTDFFFFF